MAALPETVAMIVQTNLINAKFPMFGGDYVAPIRDELRNHPDVRKKVLDNAGEQAEEDYFANAHNVNFFLIKGLLSLNVTLDAFLQYCVYKKLVDEYVKSKDPLFAALYPECEDKECLMRTMRAESKKLHLLHKSADDVEKVLWGSISFMNKIQNMRAKSQTLWRMMHFKTKEQLQAAIDSFRDPNGFVVNRITSASRKYSVSIMYMENKYNLLMIMRVPTEEMIGYDINEDEFIVPAGWVGTLLNVYDGQYLPSDVPMDTSSESSSEEERVEAEKEGYKVTNTVELTYMGVHPETYGWVERTYARLTS